MIDPDDQTEALRAQAERFAVVLANISIGVCLFDAGTRLIVSNARYAQIYGLAPEAIQPGMTLAQIVALRGVVGSVPDMSLETYVVRAGGQDMNAVSGTLVELRNGRIVTIRHQPMPDGDYVATHEDVTERRQAELRLVYLAHHDPLTGLPNRALLRERLEQALADCDADRPCAVLSLDIDRFKDVNDTLGHAVGDGVLRAVAERLRVTIPPSDFLERLGNNEFVVVQSGAGQPAGALALASRLVGRLGRSFQIDGHQVNIGASIGIAIAPRDGRKPDRLLRNAALALSAAKAGGRDRVDVYVPAMDAAAQRRRTLQSDLRNALAAGEMELAFQPIASLATGRIAGFEALLRWNRETSGRVSPAEFIPLAEQNGLIVPIGNWVLMTACAEAARWPDKLNVAVNVSAAQFHGPGLIEAVIAALQASGLAPARLELEITESAMMQNWQDTAATLQRIKQLGVRVSMDDFGTGYSSLSYLRRFPFDKVKIDQSFVRELTGRGQSIAIVRAILALCGAFGMTTTAEGVETRDQWDILAAEGCAELQGYLLSEPRPAREVSAMLARLDECRFAKPPPGTVRRPALAQASADPA